MANVLTSSQFDSFTPNLNDFGAFLGRLIYRYRDIIKPSPIINDEEEFYKFVNS